MAWMYMKIQCNTYRYTIINALMNIESNALLVPNATSVPYFPRFRVNCSEVAPCAKLCPENSEISFMDKPSR